MHWRNLLLNNDSDTESLTDWDLEFDVEMFMCQDNRLGVQGKTSMRSREPWETLKT